MQQALDIIRDTSLDTTAKRARLASAAEATLPAPPISARAQQLLDQGVLCHLNEGNAPYRPRYVLPDYVRFARQGSEYLGLAAPRDYYEGVGGLLALYRFVPSITGYPVYVGQVDEVLEPLADTVSERERMRLIELLLVQIDRTLPDAFVHMNIGPRDTRTGRLIIETSRRLETAVPNISLKYEAGVTSDALAQLAVTSALECAKPYFVNHAALRAELGEQYGVASCFNTLKIGGGSHTLVRLNLKKVAESATSYRDFFANALPEAVAHLVEICNARARFVVEEARFFESSFLAREGLIHLNRFTSMAGVYGLYEAVEKLAGGRRMGGHPEADSLAREITATARRLVKAQPGLYCEGFGGHVGFHAQSGITTDLDTTAGVRIKNGREPAMLEQARLAGSLHSHFDAGISDIYLFDKMAQHNVPGVLKIIQGALASGVRIFSMNGESSELIRITGYLVKRSDVARYRAGEPLREQTVGLAVESIDNTGVLSRRARGA